MEIEILFQSKRKDNGEWAEGQLFVGFGKTYICPEATALYFFDGALCLGGFIEVIPKTVRRFTGLTDKNGKRIFEGDIIKILPTVTFDPNCEWETCFVHFYRGSFVCSPIRFLGKDKIPGWQLRNLIENYKLVIGNIHDNPELLNGKES